MKKTGSILGGAISLATLLWPAIAFGQTAAAPTLARADQPADTSLPADIVVTAQRRTERLQDVGIAVSAFSGEQLKTRGVSQGTDIAQFTPGVSLAGSLGGQSTQFSIRGVTQSDYSDAIEAPVAVYLDDTYIASQQGQAVATFDVARVEVLKGPQGTLFGRNATGGLVNFIPNQPNTDKLSAYAEGTYGRFQQTTLEGAINIPLSDTLALRTSGYWNRYNPIYNNLYPAGMAFGAPLTFGAPGPSPAGQDVGSQDLLAGRAQLLFEPSSDLKVRLVGGAARQNLSSVPYASSPTVPVLDAQGRVVNVINASATETRSAIGPDGKNFYNPAILPFQAFMYSPNGDGMRAAGATWGGYRPVEIGDLNLSSDYARKSLNRFRVYNAALHIDIQLGGVAITSVSSFYHYKKKFLMDADGSPVDLYLFGTDSKTNSFTQEVRLSGKEDRFNWQAGVFYLHINADALDGLLGPKGSALAAAFGAAPTGIDPVNIFSLKTRSTSFFGQYDWEFVPRVKLVMGGRYIIERQIYDFSSFAAANDDDFSVDANTLLFPIQPAFADRRVEHLWAGKAQLEYRPTSSLLIYAGVNRGVKAGSYNAKLPDGSPPLSPNTIPYAPEVLTSYEGGLKLTGPGGRYTINASVYHYQYKGYQEFVFSDVSGYVQNRDARINGVELEVTARLVRGLTADVSGSIVDAKVFDVEVAPGVVRDVRPTFSPKYQASARVDYASPGDLFGGKAGGGVSLSYQSSFFHNARNFDADRLGGYALVNAYLRWSNEGGFSLSPFVNNIFDKRYKQIGFDLASSCGCNIESYGQPRTWGVRAGYKF